MYAGLPRRTTGNFGLASPAQIAGQSPMPSFVYVLAARNPDGRTITYVGWTLDLARRLAEHNGKPAGARTTRGRVWFLVYAEKHRTRKGAMRREFILKNDRSFRKRLRDSGIPTL